MADLVYIDDTDPRIEYSGSWALYPYRTDGADWGNFGPSWNTSLHVTTSSGSLSYAFRGMFPSGWLRKYETLKEIRYKRIFWYHQQSYQHFRHCRSYSPVLCGRNSD